MYTPAPDVETAGLDTGRLSHEVKIVHLSDLHGDVPPWLVQTVVGQHPDMITMTGDIFDGVQDPIPMLKALKQMKQQSGAVLFFVDGNHECYRKDLEHLHARLQEAGIHILNGNTVHCLGLAVSGIGDEKTKELARKKAAAFVQNRQHPESGIPQILLFHRPCIELADHYDLVLSGHNHGGQIRLGKIGIFGPGMTLFPKYVSGPYQGKKGILLVSRGISDHTPIPRIHNLSHILVVLVK